MLDARPRVRLLFFLGLVVLAAGFVLGTVVREERRLSAGVEVLLEAGPVDPRDPLRGDYVILAYAIEDLGRFPAPPDARPGGTVYVRLREGVRYWEPEVVLKRLPPRGEWQADEAYLRATVIGMDPLRVSYADLGEYFVPQGTGVLPEPPDVVVVIGADGAGRIQQLLIDGEPWP